MQEMIYNPRGTRAFDRRGGRVLALAATALAAAALPAQALPAARAKAVVRPLVHKAAVKALGGPDDVTLDFVAADINDVLKALAVQTHTNVVSGTDVKGNVTVSLAHVSLEEALDMISKLSGYQYARVGHSYVVGSPGSIQAMTAGGSAAAPATTAVVSFTYSSADDLGGVIKSLYPNVKTTPGKASGGQTGGVLVVSGTETDVDGVKRVVADAESVLSKGIAASRTEVYNIKYAAADDLQGVLARLVPNLVVTPGPTQGFSLKAPATADATGTTSTTTSYGGGTGGTVTATSGNVPVKPTTTSLLLTGGDADIARAEQILSQVDVRPQQISYEAKVVEINHNYDNRIGLNWDFAGASTRVGELPDASAALGANGYPGKVLKFGTFGRTPINNLVNVTLDALFQNQDAKLLANPNIAAVDGQQAAVFIGDTINYISSVTQSPTGQNITTSSVNAGIKLLVAGKVSNDGYVTVNLHPEVSLVTLANAGIGGAQLPQIHTREATTTVRVKDGDTIAIGGLINESDTRNIHKVPFLGDLPFLGNLFRDSEKIHNRDEVVIFVKVSVQKDKA